MTTVENLRTAYEAGEYTHVKVGSNISLLTLRNLTELLESPQAIGKNGAGYVWSGGEKHVLFKQESDDKQLVLDRLATACVVVGNDRFTPKRAIEIVSTTTLPITIKRDHPDGRMVFSEGHGDYDIYPLHPIRMPNVDEAVAWARNEYKEGRIVWSECKGDKVYLPVLENLFGFDEKEYPVYLVTSVLCDKDYVILNVWQGPPKEVGDVPLAVVMQKFGICSTKLTPFKLPRSKLPRNTTELKKLLATKVAEPKTERKEDAYMAEAKVANFVFDKATTNTVRYKEVIEEGKAPLMRTLYVQDYVAGEHKKVKVTLEFE